MGWLNFLERRFGRYAIPDLTWKLLGCQICVYVLGAIDPEIYNILLLDPQRIMKGEIWRLFSFIVIPPYTDIHQAIWFFFTCYFVLLMGSSLEREWGYFRYNMFWLVGIIATTFFAFFIVHGPVSNIFMGLSLFLAFATIFPEYVIYVMFVLPVRVKYLGYFAALSQLVVFVNGDLSTRVGVVVALLNYFLFFGPEFFQQARVRIQTEGQRKKFQEARRATSRDFSFHECVVCKRTDATNPELEFRVGADDQEYCMEHLKK